MKKPMISVAILSLCSSLFAQQPERDPNTIEIRVKLFNADRPAEPLTPRLIFAYRRPAEGEEPVLLNQDQLKIKPVENNFYVLTVPKGLLLERIVFLVQESQFNVAVLTKVVTANDMVVYPGASDSGGEFSFHGYKGQMALYGALYDELVEDLRMLNHQQIREMFGSQILAMPNAYDYRRLPNLDPRQRQVLHQLHQNVLRTYGYIAEPPKMRPSPKPPVYYPAQYYPVRYPQPRYYSGHCGRRLCCWRRCR